MEVSVQDVAMPGDVIKEIFKSGGTKEKTILGPGLRRDGDVVYACKAGVVKKRDPSIYYIDSYQKRYIPRRGESVVGVVTQKAGDIFKVDIGASEQASLSYMAFEGANKRNRPNVQAGDVVYAKLLVASKDMEPELICVDSHGKKGKLGILSPDGMLFTCSINLVRKILNPECPLINMLSKRKVCELAIGVNGKVWIKSRSVQDTIGIANAILATEYTSTENMKAIFDELFDGIAAPNDCSTLP
ncbi:exosome complex component RRP40 [Orussus abietinus]|uniref:exosome complex component RRP40 n=1 Tax=Orussus abietinus TaxID=222816 RepID=UPI000626C722|nr:exosome complex component RRP40 [Orussus abietinus]